MEVFLGARDTPGVKTLPPLTPQEGGERAASVPRLPQELPGLLRRHPQAGGHVLRRVVSEGKCL